MNLSADEKLLIERMSARTPVLVLGAGFSIGAKNGTGKPLMTGRELSQALFDNVLAKGRKVRKEDLAAYRQEAQDLKKTCDNIELEGLRERRDAFLKIQFGTCFCPKDDFHMLLREYPWRYIFTLNIDDLVEYIYSDCPKEQQPLVHVKQSSTLRSSASLELYKLHGSVSRPDLGYVFDSEEYRAYAASASWTLTTFGHQAMTNDVIFLGTEFQEEDMHLMLQQLAAMVEVVQPPHYFFVTPEIHDRRLSRKIQDSKNMHFIPWKTERFLRMVKAEIGDISEIRRKMRDYGMVFYDEQYPAADRQVTQYMSELYLGAPPRPLDFFRDVDIRRPELEGKAKELADKGGHHLVAVFGDAYVGKTCAATRLGVDLMSVGYEFSVFNLPYSMNATAYQERILEYLDVLPQGARVAILAERMPYYYGHVKKILNRCPPNISSLIFICTGSFQDHNSKKYLLDSYPNLEEVYISEKTRDGRLANNIYDKLEEKSHLNKLRHYGSTKRERIAYIRQLNDLIEVLYIAQEGRQFVTYFSDLIEEKADSQNKTAFLLLCTFCALDIPELPVTTFSAILACCGLSVDMRSFCQEYADLIRRQNGRVTARCSRLLWTSAQSQLHQKDILSWIGLAVGLLAKNLTEGEETFQNELFQKLLKIKNLRQSLSIPCGEILGLFLELEDACKHLSYYWVQRGILHRDMEHFEEANNAFSEASEIRNNTSYHVKHAQAKNYMAWGVWSVRNEPQHAQYYFDIGREQLETLIEKASYRYFAYSVHTYVDMMIKFYLACGTPIPDGTLRNLAQLLLRMPDARDDRLCSGIIARFVDYCRDIGWQDGDLEELKRARGKDFSGGACGLPLDLFDSDDLVDTGDDEIIAGD